MHSNTYTWIYAIVMSIVVAILLALASEGLNPYYQANVAFEKKMNILSAVGLRNLDKKEVQQLYKERIKEIVIDAKGDERQGINAFDLVLKDELEKSPEAMSLPLYIYSADDNKNYFIIPVMGKGLWGPIWGYVALQDDFTTVYNAFFDHKGETPGLGAEINTEPFQAQFTEKLIRDASGTFVSVRVLKPGQGNVPGEHRVDGISGGTITSNGTDKMLQECIKLYLPYFDRLKIAKNSES